MNPLKHALIEEFQRLKASGEESVFISDATITSLQESLQSARVSKSRVDEKPKETVVISVESSDRDLPKAQNKAPSPKTNLPETYAPLPSPPSFEIPDTDKESQLVWLKDKVLNCKTCLEHLSENGKIVFGEGSLDAEIFFCGEAPGADEELSGVPFVGSAGELLEKIIKAMGLERDAVYIANILKWRPEHNKPYGNRPPTTEEMSFCLPYVKAQIEIIQPKAVIALGNTAVNGFLGPDSKRRMGTSRGSWHQFEGTPLIITFHPAYLLRNDTLKTKRLIWEDMLQVMEKVDLPISEKQRAYFLK